MLLQLVFFFADCSAKLTPGNVMQCIVLTTSGDQTIITLSNDEKKLNQVLVSLWVD